MKKQFTRFIPAVLLTVFATGVSAQSVYLAEAARKPFERTVFIDDKGENFRYTAFYRGAAAPEGDISVSFSVDAAKAATYNSQNGTSYKMLPKGSYTLGTVSDVISQGSVSAAPGEIRVTGKGYLKPFEKYLLPVTVDVNGDSVCADPLLSTVYYVITAVPAPGTVARKQIGRLPSGTKSVFGLFGGKYLIAVGGNGELTSYRYSGGSLGKAATVEAPGNLKEMDIVINFRDRHLIGLYRGTANGQLIGFPIFPGAPKVGNPEKTFGTSGYNIFSDIFPDGTNLYCRKPNGELMLYPLTESLEWGGSGVRSLGSGWTHPVIFGYGGSLIAVDIRGDMWKYSLLANGETGLPKKIGTGWNIYEKIAVAGTDLLCVDGDGIVWQIKFDDKGYWAL